MQTEIYYAWSALKCHDYERINVIFLPILPSIDIFMLLTQSISISWCPVQYTQAWIAVLRESI